MPRRPSSVRTRSSVQPSAPSAGMTISAPRAARARARPAGALRPAKTRTGPRSERREQPGPVGEAQAGVEDRPQQLLPRPVGVADGEARVVGDERA